MYKNSGSLEPECARVQLLSIVDGKAWIARKVKNKILRKQCRLLGRNLRGKNKQFESVRAPFRRLVDVIARETKLWWTVRPKQYPLVPILIRMAAYGKEWHRSPESWSPLPGIEDVETQIRSLLAHVFVKYEVPQFLYQAWLVRGDLRWRERDWFCQLAQGASWRSLAGFPNFFHRRALHEARNAPSHLSVMQGLRWGQVKAFGGSKILAREVLASRMAVDCTHEAIWCRLIEKFSAQQQRWAAEFGSVSDMLRELLDNDDLGKVERLLILPIIELCTHSRKFWKERHKMFAASLPEWQQRFISNSSVRAQMSKLLSCSWKPFATKLYDVSQWNDRKKWRAKELTTAFELLVEGRVMRHCINSYLNLCLSQYSAVYSFHVLLKERETRMTVEVECDVKEIVEVHKKWNKLPDAHEWEALAEWAEHNGWKIN